MNEQKLFEQIAVALEPYCGRSEGDEPVQRMWDALRPHLADLESQREDYRAMWRDTSNSLKGVIAQRDAANEQAERQRLRANKAAADRDAARAALTEREADLQAALARAERLQASLEGRDLEQRALRNAIEVLAQIREIVTDPGMIHADLFSVVVDIRRTLAALDAPADTGGTA